MGSDVYGITVCLDLITMSSSLLNVYLAQALLSE